MHAAGIVHRDVKPGNILLDEHDRSHLTDFGIARPQDATAMTQTGMVLGTMRYLAPEVAEGEPGDGAQRPLLGRLRAARGRRRRPAAALRELIDALTEDDPERRPASADDALAMLDDGRGDAGRRRRAAAARRRERAATRGRSAARRASARSAALRRAGRA